MTLPEGEGAFPPLSENALRVLARRYLRRDEQGRPIESPDEMFRRVARAVAEADRPYGGESRVRETEEAFFRSMRSLEMLPNSPTLMNAGRELGQLSACFVLPVGDSMESIFEAIGHTALIHKSGGGTGFSFSRVRPRNDQVRSTKGVSSGPISFMTVFDAATETIKQGGMRRGANMGVLSVDHPDILEFITCKEESNRLNNFNISVALTESFMQAVEADGMYELINPRTGKVVGRLRAREVFDRIVESAWRNGEPGILFIDRINRDNPTPALGRIESTNPCGEQPLLPFESCNLGSVNLARIVGENGIDWEKLRRIVHLGVHFLDNVIDVNRYPLDPIERMTKSNRKIGLGVMGFADLLILLGIPYDSDDAIELAEQIMGFIAAEAVRASEDLAAERGPFPNFPKSVYAEKGLPPRRNATTTTIAPTGTISLIAGCSSGIEPLFAVAYVRNVLDDEQLVEVHPFFEEIAKREGFYTEECLEKILSTGSVQAVDGIPERWKRVFVTSHDIAPEWHIRMQAAFQRHTENSVSKTVNFPEDATKEDVRKAFWLAYTLGCKGVTIYRDRSRNRQVLRKGVKEPSQPPEEGEGRGAQAPYLAPRPRPELMQGITKRMDTSCGALYVTINWDETGRPFEVFTSMGKAGGCAASQSEAIGRLVSLALRSGIAPEQIVRQLRGIRCHLPRGFGKKKISSCADAVAQALQSFLEAGPMAGRPPSKGERRQDDGTEPAVLSDTESGILFLRGACPECQGPLEREGGCCVCRNCGYSDCL